MIASSKGRGRAIEAYGGQEGKAVNVKVKVNAGTHSSQRAPRCAAAYDEVVKVPARSSQRE